MKAKHVKKLLALFLAGTLTAGSFGIPGIGVEASEAASHSTVSFAAQKVAAHGSFTMETGAVFGESDFSGVSFNGTNGLEISAADMPNEMGLFRSNIVDKNSLEISMTFQIASAATNYINLLEICDSTANSSASNPASTIAVIVSKSGQVFFEAGSHKTGTDWSMSTGVNLADNQPHTLKMTVSGKEFSCQIDNGTVHTVSTAGNRNTQKFVKAFFGGTEEGYTDWRGSVDSIVIGGLREGSFFANSNYSNLNGSISAVSICGVNDESDITGSAVRDAMFAKGLMDNTWLFGGGVETQGRFAEIGGVRNFIGQFEEYVRWVKRIDGIVEGMQRYTINAGKAGQDAAAFADNLDSLIEKVQPKAVSYLIGPEDYKKGEDGTEAFQAAIAEIIEKSLAMKENAGCIVIQLPHVPKEDADEPNASLYAQTARTAVKEAADKDAVSAERITVVDHLKETAGVAQFKKNMLTEDGLLNAEGHLEMAKQFAKAVYGENGSFPSIDNSWTAEEGGAEAYIDESPEVTAGVDSLKVSVPGRSETEWKYILAVDDTEVTGRGFGNPFTIESLPSGKEYTLTVQTGNDSIQMSAVKGKVEAGNQAERLMPDGGLAKAIREKADKKDKPLTWVFMGDSITHSAVHTYGYDGIAQIFEKYVKEDLGRADDIVVNTAVSGATAERTLTQMEQRVLKYKPDIVSIMLGTNDSRNITSDTYKQQMQTIVSQIRETCPDAVIIFRTPTPANVSGWASASKFPGENGFVAAMKNAADEDGNILFIDQYTDWEKECSSYSYLRGRGYYFGDAVHPGGVGHLRMAQQFIRECGLDTNTRIASLVYHFDYAEETSAIEPEVTVSEEKDAVTVSKTALNAAYTAGDIGEITVSLTDPDGRTYTKESGPDEEEVTLKVPSGKRYTVEVTANIKGSAAKHAAFAKQDILLTSEQSGGADQSAADGVAEKIEEIAAWTTEEEILAHKQEIEAARTAYDALTALQKLLVSNETIKVLSNAEAVINKNAAEAFLEQIRAIESYTEGEPFAEYKQKIEAARSAYNGMSETQKLLVPEEALEKLLEAETAVSNQEAINLVLAKINAIGTVANTPECRQKIQEARAAYNALSPEQNELIPTDTLKILTDAETEYQALVKQAEEEAKRAEEEAAKRAEEEAAKRAEEEAAKNQIQEGKVYESGSYRYKIISLSNRTVEAAGFVKKSKKIAVPNTVKIGTETYKVVSIGASAFQNQKKVTQASIGSNVKIIGKNAFKGCSKLKKITIKSKALTRAEKNAFKGIHKKAVIKVPAAKLAKYKGLLAKKGQSKTVKIKK